MFPKLSVAMSPRLMSSNLAIGTATAFVLAAAFTSLMVDHGVADHGVANHGVSAPLTAPIRADWSLRGTLPPSDHPLRTLRMPAISATFSHVA